MNSTMNSESQILNEFNTLQSSSEVLFIVFFRGHWCPFCMSYLTTLTSMLPSLAAANTTPVIITSESAEHLPATRKSSGYTGKAIVDPENILATEFKKRGWVEVAISEKKGYPHGMAQPAILVLKNNKEVLEKWAIVPSLMNMGGAKDRPELEQVWENVQATLKGQQRVHKVYSLQGALGVIFKKLFG